VSRPARATGVRARYSHFGAAPGSAGQGAASRKPRQLPAARYCYFRLDLPLQ